MTSAVQLICSQFQSPMKETMRVVLLVLLALIAIVCLLDLIWLFGTRHVLLLIR